jgi:uncharacterized protein YcnI
MIVKRLAVVSAVAAALLLSGAPAYAHVSVSPGTAEPGAYVKESFRVPNEKSTASTVQLEVVFPTDHPVPSTQVEPVPGWTATVEKKKLPAPVKTVDGELTEAISSVTWKGGAIKPGEFLEFSVALGPLPKDTDKLVFKALQTYSDGSVVRWIETPQDGQPEPEHPAAVLNLKAPAAAPAPAAPAEEGDTVARILSAVGALAGLVALGWVAALSRRPVPAPSADRTPEKSKARV